MNIQNTYNINDYNKIINKNYINNNIYNNDNEFVNIISIYITLFLQMINCLFVIKKLRLYVLKYKKYIIILIKNN